MTDKAEVTRRLESSDGEVAVIGLGKSGFSAAKLLVREGQHVYASDSSGSEAAKKAAEELRNGGTNADPDKHDLARIGRAKLVVASPGVPPNAPALEAARKHNVPIVGEVEIALRALPGLKYIAVTGTNGKTTTTALIGHLLRTLGYVAPDAGNIGTPLADVALRDRRPDWVALEMSSFQLHDTPSLNPAVGLLTNLSPDHLDRYPSVEEYYADKKLLFSNAHDGSRWVLNADDAGVMEMANGIPGHVATFSVRHDQADAHLDEGHHALMYHHDAIMAREELALIGDHNVANALAAWLAVMEGTQRYGDHDAWNQLHEGLASFKALKHRMETVGEHNGVQWINDSKATNVSSTLVAVEGMTKPYILLLGGRHKGEAYTAVAEPFRKHGKVVIAYGEAAPIIEQDLAGLIPVERMESDFAAVVARARSLAQTGDAVLLSPACSSYDMFDNYEQRGADFKRLAAETK